MSESDSRAAACDAVAGKKCPKHGLPALAIVEPGEDPAWVPSKKKFNRAGLIKAIGSNLHELTLSLTTPLYESICAQEKAICVLGLEPERDDGRRDFANLFGKTRSALQQAHPKGFDYDGGWVQFAVADLYSWDKRDRREETGFMELSRDNGNPT